MSKLWTETEINRLKEYYPKLGKCQELSSLFPDRTLEAVIVKATKMGLKVLCNIRAGRSHEDYLSLLDTEKFTPLEKYRGATVPILHKCNLCLHEWYTRPQALLKPRSLCPICSHKARLVPLSEVDEVLAKSNLERLSEYTGSLDSITLKHRICGYVWNTKYSHVQQGSGCPKCNSGFGYLIKESLPETAYLYCLDVLLVTEERFLKVGVTSRSNIQKRINEVSSSIGLSNVISIKPLIVVEGSGKHIVELENSILDDPYIPKYVCSREFVGCTELKNIEYYDSILYTITEKATENSVKII